MCNFAAEFHKQLKRKKLCKVISHFAGDKSTDWMVHMLGQAVASYTDATHGHTLSAVSGAYYRFLIEHSEDAKRKFERLAKNVWDLNASTQHRLMTKTKTLH